MCKPLSKQCRLRSGGPGVQIMRDAALQSQRAVNHAPAARSQGHPSADCSASFIKRPNHVWRHRVRPHPGARAGAWRRGKADEGLAAGLTTKPGARSVLNAVAKRQGVTGVLLRGLRRSAARRSVARRCGARCKAAAKLLQSPPPHKCFCMAPSLLVSQAWLSGELILRAERRGLEELPAALWRKTTARQLILMGTRCRALRAAQQRCRGQMQTACDASWRV